MSKDTTETVKEQAEFDVLCRNGHRPIGYNELGDSDACPLCHAIRATNGVIEAYVTSADMAGPVTRCRDAMRFARGVGEPK